MAKKGQRILIALKCATCKAQNYISEKNKLNTKDKIELKKWCKFCKKVTQHKETTKLD